MKGDFTRDTFQARKHFSRVLMQQGRVQVEADWNEQAAILLHYLRARTEDLIGPHGGPQDYLGFEIGEPKDNDLHLGPGRYYVDGLLCENETTGHTYLNQPDYSPGEAEALPKAEPYLVYLDVWERHISRLEDPAICEIALGGPDTATRAKVIWQVKLAATAKSPKLADEIKKMSRTDFREWLKGLDVQVAAGTGQLRARIKPDLTSADPCTLPPDSRYRGAENQLYRVEIHTVTDKETTFKWSRDNGSVAALCLQNEGPALVVSNTRGFAARDWVELVTNAQELRGEAGVLVNVERVESDRLVLESAPSGVNWDDPVKVRRWDQTETERVRLTNGAVSVIEGQWLDLEDGVQVWFEKEKDAHYRVGDYWLMPARTLRQDIEWPQLNAGPALLPPHGIDHHYAPLALINWGAGGGKGGKAPISGSVDLRRSFAPQAQAK